MTFKSLPQLNRKSNHIVKGDIERYPSRTGMYIVQHHRLHHVADLGTFQPEKGGLILLRKTL